MQNKKVDLNKIGVFWTTPPFVDYVWMVRGGLDKEIVSKISQALLKLDYQNPEQRKLLELHRTKGYLPAKDADWKSVEDAAVLTGLMQSK